MNYAYSWEWSFYLQALAIIPCAIFFLLTPDHYLNIQKTVEFRKEIAEKIHAENNRNKEEIDLEGSDKKREKVFKKALAEKQKERRDSQ